VHPEGQAFRTVELLRGDSKGLVSFYSQIMIINRGKIKLEKRKKKRLRNGSSNNNKKK